MARLAIPEQLAARQTKHSLACPSRRTPCMVPVSKLTLGKGSCGNSYLTWTPDFYPILLEHHLRFKVRRVRRPTCGDRTNLSPVGQPSHHAGHSKEDREEVKGETLPAIISSISLLGCESLTHCAIYQAATCERDCSSTPSPERRTYELTS